MGMTETDSKMLKGGGRAVEPLAVRVDEVKQILGVSRSEAYRLLASGALRAVKQGHITLVLMDSIREHLASLPPATFRNQNAA
jgi:hypothetical protein